MGTLVPQPSQVMSWPGIVVVASMLCSFGEGPGGGVWMVVCSDAGGHAAAIGRERNWLARPAKMFFQRSRRKLPAEPVPGSPASGKDLEWVERAEREAGCAPGRGCEADKSVHAAGPATGARHGAQAPVVARTFSWRCCLQRW
jgi:hypothetical protein